MRTLLAIFGITAVAFVVYLGKSYDNSLQALDSTTHAHLALQVTKHGLVPALPMQHFTTNQRLNPEFNDHPFTLFYLAGHVMRALGPSAWSARLVPGLFSVGCVLLLVWLGTLLYSPAVGLAASGILLFTRDFVLIGSRFHLDTAMIFFILLSFVFWVKRWPYWAAVSAGLGFWIKGPVALLLFPSVGLAALMTSTLTRTQIILIAKSSALSLLIGSIIWIITGLIGGWHLIPEYFGNQVFGTAVGGRGTPDNTEPFLGLELLKDSYLPWVLFLVMAVIYSLKKRRWLSPEFALVLSASIVLEVVISALRFKHPWYYLPIYPFLALLIVDPIRHWLKLREKKVFNFYIGLGMIVPTALVVTPIELGPENFPALRRFNAIIQAYGSNDDAVLFIEGGQPFGTELDSLYEIQFYTQRKVLQSHCVDLSSVIKAHHPAWLISTTDCDLSAHAANYPAKYTFGRQRLWSRIIPTNEASTGVDLTPLARELKPTRDGRSVDYPRNPYFPHVR